MRKELLFEAHINQVKTDVEFRIDKGGHSSWSAMNPIQYRREKLTDEEMEAKSAVYRAELDFKQHCQDASMHRKLQESAKHWTVAKGRFYFSYGAFCYTQAKEVNDDGTLIDIDESALEFSTSNSSMQEKKFFTGLYHGLKVTM